LNTLKTRLPAFILILGLFLHGSTALTIPSGQPDENLTPTPRFEMWVECVSRGPYVGRADAQLSYRYDGAFAIMAEDSRYYGDIGTQYIQLMPFAVEPGDHHQFTQVSVGAFKAVMWKVVFLDELHVLTIWDDPAIADCPWQAEPTATPDNTNTL
jgi:hypothetical protein